MVEVFWEGRGFWVERRREERLVRNRGVRVEFLVFTV